MPGHDGVAVYVDDLRVGGDGHAAALADGLNAIAGDYDIALAMVSSPFMVITFAPRRTNGARGLCGAGLPRDGGFDRREFLFGIVEVDTSRGAT